MNRNQSLYVVSLVRGTSNRLAFRVFVWVLKKILDMRGLNSNALLSVVDQDEADQIDLAILEKGKSWNAEMEQS